MRKVFVFSLFILLSWAGISSSEEKSTIELTDGSVITGEIIEMRGGSYRVRSDSLGEIRIESNRIRSITSSSARNTGKSQQGKSFIDNNNNNANNNAQINEIQQSIMSDPKMAELVQTLMSDPELMNALNNPAILAKINSGDTASLENDRDFQKIMANPKIREIVHHFKTKYQNQTATPSRK
jgi:uncharacterized protein YbaA (DUF1428 family)